MVKPCVEITQRALRCCSQCTFIILLQETSPVAMEMVTKAMAKEMVWWNSSSISIPLIQQLSHIQTVFQETLDTISNLATSKAKKTSQLTWAQVWIYTAFRVEDIRLLVGSVLQIYPRTSLTTLMLFPFKLRGRSMRRRWSSLAAVRSGSGHFISHTAGYIHRR